MVDLGNISQEIPSGVTDQELIAARISEVARVNGLQIHPGQDAVKWAALVIRKGGCCPCVPGRDHCPCEEFLVDIAQINRCRCGLFVNQAYIEEYNRLLAERHSRRSWKRRPKASS